MNKNKFTILTASYNSGRYLNDWADSILLQKYRPLEVVIVEDMSQDNSLHVLKKQINRFKLNNIEVKFIVNNKKMYCGSSYNLAFKKSTGYYFGILDSDDALEPFVVEYIVDLYEKNKNISWIYTQYNKYNRKMDRIIKRGFCRVPSNKKSILDMEKNGINTYGHWRTFSNRIHLKKNLFGKGLKCCVDKHLGFRLEEEGIGMFVDKVCYKYRTRSKGEKSVVFSNNLKKEREKICNIFVKRRKKNNNKIYGILNCKKT